MGITKIEWTSTALPDGTIVPGYSFNSWLGCQKISPACDACYAESWAKRTGQSHLWAGERRRTTPAYWRKPFKWDTDAEKAGIQAKVFCASLADVFDNQVPIEWRYDLWELISYTYNLNWLMLTKRPQNISKMLPERWAWPDRGHWRNVWLGATVENNAAAERIKYLRDVPAAVRFLSVEPLLEAIEPNLDGISWVIVGGESGGKARPMHPAWARRLRDQCKERGVAFFMKQVGSNHQGWPSNITGKGDNIAQFPTDLQLREFPR